MKSSPRALETLALEVPDAALEPFEAALGSACETVGFFRQEPGETWRIEGVKEVGAKEAELAGALALAAALTGADPTLERTPTPAEGWLARSYAGFPEQLIGRRFAVRGSHLPGPDRAGRITLTLDAGIAFGSGEHGSTRGCLRALEIVARSRRPRRILDLGTGSGILAIAAVRLTGRPVRAADIEPWSVRLARRNAAANGVGPLVRVGLGDGWRSRFVRACGPYDVVLANILARPLTRMARALAANLAPGGVAILSGLLAEQARHVLAAHRRAGLVEVMRIADGQWATLVVGRRGVPHLTPALSAPEGWRGGKVSDGSYFARSRIET